jgi:hypothetical protein
VLAEYAGQGQHNHTTSNSEATTRKGLSSKRYPATFHLPRSELPDATTCPTG